MLDLSTGEFDGIYRLAAANGLGFTAVTGWLSATVAIGRASFSAAGYLDGSTDTTFRGIPALIDFGTGVVSPIADFVPQLAGKSGGPVPRHIVVGPFARVSTPEDCLNVRATASTTGAVLGCYTDGVLLPLQDDAAVSDGQEWLAVDTPDGREGWAVARYLVPSTPSTVDEP